MCSGRPRVLHLRARGSGTREGAAEINAESYGGQLEVLRPLLRSLKCFGAFLSLLAFFFILKPAFEV